MPDTPGAYHEIRHKLQEVRSLWRQTKVLEGACRFLSVLLVAAFVSMGLQILVPLPAPVRVMLAAVLIGLLLLGLSYWVLRPASEEMSEERVAVFVEQRLNDEQGGLQNGLINAVQLAKLGSRAGAKSLTEAAIQRAAQHVSGRKLTRAVDLRPLARLGTATLVVVLASAILVWVFPGQFASAFGQLLSPATLFSPPLREQ